MLLSSFFLPRGRLCHRLDGGFLALLSRYREQHFGLAGDALARLLRRRWRMFLLGNAAPERIHEVHDILRARGGPLTRRRDAGLLLLDHVDHSVLVVVDKL